MPMYLIKVCLNTSYMYTMDVGSNQRWSIASTMTSWNHSHLIVTQNFQNPTQLWECYGIRVHLYAYVTHWKVLKHFIYVQYGCGEQSAGVYSLNHDIMASFLLDSHQDLPKSDLASTVYGVRVHLYAYVPHWKVLHHFIYVQYGCGEQSAVVYSLNHDIIASFPLDSHQELPKSDQASAV